MIGSMMFPQILLCLKDFLAYMTFPWNKVKTVYFKNTEDKNSPKAEFSELLLLKLTHLFAREILLVKKLEIEEAKTT